MNSPSLLKNESIFNELFNSILGEESLDECLRKAEWLTSNLEELPTQLNKPRSPMSTTPVKKLTVKTEKVEYNPIDLLTDTNCNLLKGMSTPYSRRSIMKPELIDSGSEPKRSRTLTDSTDKWIPELENCDLLNSLSKNEERALKKMRRKIKNKISAQESRRKKKEYVEGLERRITVFSMANEELKDRLAELENINREMQEKIIVLTSGKTNAAESGTQTEIV